MSSPYTPYKIVAGTKTVVGLGLMAVGFALARGPLVFPGVLAAFWGTIVAAKNFGMFVRLVAAEQLLRESRGDRQQQEFRRATLPNKIFLLLFAVAEIDGKADDRERDVVRRFLLERFPRPDIAAEIRAWSARSLSPQQIDELVHELRAILTQAECETVFAWCCYLSLIDQRFSPVEHELLQRISRHLGIHPVHAKRVFAHAKHTVLGERGAGFGWTGTGSNGSSDRRSSGRSSSSGGWSGQQGSGSGSSGQGSRSQPPRPRVSERQRALDILGLDAGATSDDVRKRHRELVRKYHPDAHSHLGPVAAKEATERFREIQSAYELLRS